MKFKWRVSAIVLLILLALVMGVWLRVLTSVNYEGHLKAAGTVEATEAQLGFQAAGRIEKIAVHEGNRVQAGLEIARLDRTEMLARKDEAEARVALARALLEELERGFRSEEIAQGRAALAAAQDRLQDAQRDLDRAEKLQEQGAVSQEVYDKARVAFDVARSQYEQAVEQLTILETGPRKERVAAQRAQVAQAEAAVRVIEAVLANMTVRAPFEGVVTVRNREPGEVVPAGSPVLTIMNPDDRWVRIYIPETRMGAVRIGQAARITSDTYRDKDYKGVVSFIASEAEFTPKSVQTTEERVKLVYAVKVRITEDPSYDLKPGMPADVQLELEEP